MHRLPSTSASKKRRASKEKANVTTEPQPVYSVVTAVSHPLIQAASTAMAITPGEGPPPQVQHHASPPHTPANRDSAGSVVSVASASGVSVDYETATMENLRKIIVSGSGIDGSEVTVNDLTGFSLSMRGAGTGELSVNVRDPDGKKVKATIERVSSGTYQCLYKPVITGVHSVFVIFKGMNIIGSPFKVMASEYASFGSDPGSSSPRESMISMPDSFMSQPAQPDRRYQRRPSVPNIPFSDALSLARTSFELRSDSYLPISEDPYSKSDALDRNAFLESLSPATREGLIPCLRKVLSFELGQDIGEGHFGIVKEARYTEVNQGSIIVAAKKLKDKYNSQKEHKEDFLREPILMSKFKHDNVLELVDVVVYYGTPYIVMPLMKWGNLLNYIQNHKDALKGADLLSFCLQISRGMEYISSRKIVHRDLAARNCMLSENHVVKICDFGLARDTIRNPYVMLSKEKRLPIRWMAPEISKSLAYSTATDVWAFAVTLWEIFSYGAYPYEDVKNEVLFLFLESGNRLEKPDNVPVTIYQLMLRCWDLEAAKRPEFSEIAKTLGEQYDSGAMDEEEEEEHTYEQPV